MKPPGNPTNYGLSLAPVFPARLAFEHAYGVCVWEKARQQPRHAAPLDRGHQRKTVTLRLDRAARRRLNDTNSRLAQATTTTTIPLA